MCEVKSRGKKTKNKTKNKIQWSVAKKMDYDEPHMTSNKKM
jgi:hypothetical protein